MWTLFDKAKSMLCNGAYKTSVCLFFTIVAGNPLQAQPRPQYSLYAINSYLVNPAIGGIESYSDLRLGHRSQWVGIDGAPVTSYLSFHMPINKGLVRPSVVNPVEKKFDLRANHENNGINKHHGVGGGIQLDQTGSYSRTQFSMSYSYHLPLSKKLSVSAGVAAGFIQYRIDQAKVKLANSNDPVLAGSTSDLQPNLDLGLWIYSQKFYTGVSATNLLASDPSFSAVPPPGTATQLQNYYWIVGYRMPYGARFFLTPSVLLRKSGAAPFTLDVALKAIYDNRVWGGAAARSNESLVGFFGASVNSNFDFTYSYDYGLGNTLEFLGRGTHEIVIGIRLNNKAKSFCPVQPW
ncbi:MAG: type IX secretion system membrane protein PorP/SprF [Flammeovirgaceae bacterium]